MNKKELQNAEMQILDEIASFCEKENISYSLFFGSLLGAVRHHGFIPWDDDMDICMLREDYEKFLRLFRSDANGRYQVISVGDEGYIYSFAKVFDTRYPIRENSRFDCGIGIYVDIFPIDGVPRDPKAKKKHFASVNRSKILWSGAINPANGSSKNPLKRLYSRIFNQKRTAALAGAMNKKAKKYPLEFGSDGEAAAYSEISGARLATFPADSFCSLMPWQFEDRSYYIPRDYHKILTVLYGDYMQLPKPEERVPAHSFTVI